MTYLFVHGGGATGRTWDRLRPLLDGPSVAVDLPGRNGVPGSLESITVEDEVAVVVAAARAIDGPITLVAHSSGGLVVPDVVAALDGRVRTVALVAALVPPEGGTGLDCMRESHREGLKAAVAAGPITLPGPPDDPEPFRLAYGGDPLDDDALAFVVDPERCVPDTVHHYFQPVFWSIAAGTPVTYVHTRRDRPVRPDAQMSMIEHLPGPVQVAELDTGHLPFVTDPQAVADILVAL